MSLQFAASVLIIRRVCTQHITVTMILFFIMQGLKKVLSSCLGEVGFPARHITFQFHSLGGQGPRQIICQLNQNKSKETLAQCKTNLRAACLKGKRKNDNTYLNQWLTPSPLTKITTFNLFLRI